MKERKIEIKKEGQKESKKERKKEIKKDRKRNRERESASGLGQIYNNLLPKCYIAIDALLTCVRVYVRCACVYDS